MSRARTKLLFVVAFAVVESASSNSAVAYDAVGPRWPADVPCSGDACLSQPFTLRYSYVNMFDGGLKMPDNSSLSSSVIKQSIEEALGLWASVIPVNFVEVPNTGSPQFRFLHRAINGPDPPGGPPTTKALSTCLGIGGGCTIDFDDTDPWQPVGTVPVPDVLGITIHEVGHVLGLDHSLDPNANMYYIARRMNGPGTGFLYTDDVQGIQFLYGSGTGSVSAIPEPATLPMTAALLAAWTFLAGRTRRRRTPV